MTLALLLSLAAAAQPLMAQTAQPQPVQSQSEVMPPLNAVIGKSMLIRLPAPVARMSVGNPVVADVNLLNPTELYLLGKEIGSTNLIVWYKGGGTTVTDINVNIDTANLESQLRQLMPGEKDIRVSTAADSIVLQGTVSDSSKADQAMSIAEAYVRKFNRSLVTDVKMPGKDQPVNISLGSQNATSAVQTAGARIINMLRVGAQQQVMLEVKIAEINKTLAERLGFDFYKRYTGDGGAWTKTISGVIGGKPAAGSELDNILRSGSIGTSSTSGVTSASGLSNSLSNSTGFSPVDVSAFPNAPIGATANLLDGSGATFAAGVTVPTTSEIPITLLQNTAEQISTSLSTSSSNLTNSASSVVSSLSQMVPGTKDFTDWLIDAQKTDGLVKILAEPTIVAISGQEGSFLAGGEIMIPVAQQDGVIQLEEKQFGVGLSFTPTVLEGGRINIKVAPEVSEFLGFRDITSNQFGTTSVPFFSTRRVKTTVQLLEGQSLAIGGLLRDDFREAVQRFPVLGEIPILGTLFRSSDYQKEKTELLIVVTPRLSKPLAPDYVLPTDSFVEPSRSELLFEGKMEGRKPENGEQPKPAANPQPTSGGFEVK